ncbi:carbon-nitrogen hydrolase family protein [Candidatus Woesearchaeota archaeon]|nr:carbon-nitrogen hydrolase family protein [Candidatus Woesearchaeota archaeon]
MEKFRVAAVQLNLQQSLPSIVRDMKSYIRSAKKKNVNIICFPECSLIAGPKKNKEMLTRIRDYCKANEIWCIAGGHLKEGGYVYNTALLIDDAGNIRGKHKKVHICDSPNVSAGSSFEVYKTPFGKIGIAICWDVAFPTAMESMAKKGAKVVFCPMYWSYDPWAHRAKPKKFEKKILQSLILTRSFENLAYHIFCNAYDPKDRTVTAYSAIAEPHKILTEIFGKEGMIMADINLDYLNNLRQNYVKEYHKVVSA